MLQKTALAIFSLWLAGCSSIQLPQARLCIADPIRARFICYDMATDYTVVNNQLQLRPGAQATYPPLRTTNDVKFWTCTAPNDWAAIKAWAQAEAQAYSNCTCQ